MSTSLKGGRVVRIRVNPLDLMACIDLVRKSGNLLPGMSLDMVVRMALSGLLHVAKSAGSIPQRDGFEYEQMVSPFINAHHGRKMNVANVIENEEGYRRAQDIVKPIMELPASTLKGSRDSFNPDDAFDQAVMKKGRLMLRIHELQFKQEADPDNFDEQDQRELAALQSEYDVLDKVEPM